MAESIHSVLEMPVEQIAAEVPFAAEEAVDLIEMSKPVYQAYRLLHVAFIGLPIVAGIDKFLHLLGNWDDYLAPRIASMLGANPHGVMMLVGVLEVIAGIVVALRPRIGGWIVAGWLWVITINLVMSGRNFDIALRDVALSLAAVALARISEEFYLKPAEVDV